MSLLFGLVCSYRAFSDRHVGSLEVTIDRCFPISPEQLCDVTRLVVSLLFLGSFYCPKMTKTSLMTNIENLQNHIFKEMHPIVVIILFTPSPSIPITYNMESILNIVCMRARPLLKYECYHNMNEVNKHPHLAYASFKKVMECIRQRRQKNKAK